MKTIHNFLHTMGSIPFKSHLLIGFALRLGLVAYSVIHDSVFELKYTDIDYKVFTDGATGLLKGVGSRPHFAHINGTLIRTGSEPMLGPYEATTYRYSPLIALLVVPSLYTIESFGKVIFSCMDIACAPLQFRLLTKVGTPSRYATLSVALLWIYNPLPLIVSTRGSSDSLMSLLVLAVLWEVSHRRSLSAGLIFGIAVHLKLYPIIYAPSLFLYLVSARQPRKSTLILDKLVPNWDAIKFITATVLSFSLLTGGSFLAYGNIYLQEAWIYHLTRRDTAHNFSPYFYLYRIFDKYKITHPASNFLSFAPQAISLAGLIALYGLRPLRPHPVRLYGCMFFCTLAFVSLNKVCTSQYFLWYLTLLPLVAPYISISLLESLCLLASWLAGQAVWLAWAYMYEYVGRKSALGPVAASSVLFMCINICLLVRLMHRFVL